MEYPISMSPPMAEAILAERKTETRRPLRPQPPYGTDAVLDVPGQNRWWAARIADEDTEGVTYMPVETDGQREWKCPYERGNNYGCARLGDRARRHSGR